MDFQKMLDGLIPVLGQAGVSKLSDEFKDLAAGAENATVKMALALVADAVTTHGLDGIEMARKAIHDVLDNKVPQIDWANPRTASDFVASLQNAEADEKSATRDFFVKLGGTLGSLLAGLIKGMSAN